MKKCEVCGAERLLNAVRCADCGTFYPTLKELFDAEVRYEEQQSVKGWIKRMLSAESTKQAVYDEFKAFKAGLSKTALLTLYVIAAFVFALLITVL